MATEENLVGYLLNALDLETHQQVEASLAANAEARQRLEVLRQSLDLLAADAAEVEPPAGLTVRTLARVAEYCCRDLPSAPLTRSARSVGSSPPFWRRADVLVAAALLITVLGVGVPWVLTSRDRSLIEQCRANLKQVSNALYLWKDQQGGGRTFPDVAQVQAPRPAAGLVFPILIADGVLPGDTTVHCPASGGPVACPLSLKQILVLDLKHFEQYAPTLSPGYAYTLGHVEGIGPPIGPRLDEGRPSALLPIMADVLGQDGSSGNSPNHGGKGQNVLFLDGHVKFCATRNTGVEQDDIYLNKQHKVKAGLDWKDTVLGDSAARP